ncbi:hypothetical protein ACFSCX_12205 [Bacillus salitolerans]|uniref:Spore germination protein n=1 Tax=Bacillus salitolerans TaxID=1437434 RepID=A0ABW4LQG2_9BACI
MKAHIQFGDINVKNIDTSSGIFISQLNIANGWSSQLKNNLGLGRIGDQAEVKNTFSFVSDDDIIDSPMEDNSVLVNKSVSSQTESDIAFAGIKATAVNTNATISVGENNQPGWSSKEKENIGNSIFVGESIAPQNNGIIYDDDLVDAPVHNRKVTINGM